jgi:hypothetical protein
MSEDLVLTSIPAEDIQQGDMLRLWLGARIVTAIEPYHGVNEAIGAFAIAYWPAPQARDGRSGITLFRGELYDVYRPPTL